MNSDQRKDYALQLFLHGNITQQQIAERVGVSVQTISAWKSKNGWDNLKKSLITTRKVELARLYDELSEINDHVQKKPEGQRWATTHEANIRANITKAIRDLEVEISFAQTFDVFVAFSEWLQEVDLKKAQEFLDYQDAFMRNKF